MGHWLPPESAVEPEGVDATSEPGRPEAPVASELSSLHAPTATPIAAIGTEMRKRRRDGSMPAECGLLGTTTMGANHTRAG